MVTSKPRVGPYFIIPSSPLLYQICIASNEVRLLIPDPRLFFMAQLGCWGKGWNFLLVFARERDYLVFPPQEEPVAEAQKGPQTRLQPAACPARSCRRAIVIHHVPGDPCGHASMWQSHTAQQQQDSREETRDNMTCPRLLLLVRALAEYGRSQVTAVEG